MLRVVRVLAHNPGVFTLEGTNTWIVGEDPSVVIDPGPADSGHVRMVRREAGRIAAIMLTHGHEDHAPGAADLAAETGAPVLAFDPGVVPGSSVRPLRDGHLVETGGGNLRVVHTPGHSPDSVAFYAGGTGALFTGDTILGRGTSLIDPPEGNLATYLKSLKRLGELGARVIYPGHGPAVFNAGAKIEEYVAHRAERERQVIDALAEGPLGLDEIVSRVYPDLDEALVPLASRSALAQLEKLMSEDKVERVRGGGLERFGLNRPRACERCGGPVKGRARLCPRCSLGALQEPPARA
jgi:glyoxylase-like metal-dependent hydrolase (beta-lactamase superfamily II)